MPGPGGPGGGGPGGGGPGGRGGPGGPGGFHGGGPGFGGPGFRGGPGHHPPPAGMFFGGPGLRPGYGYGGPPPGPMGGPWCCWPFLCVLVFVITVSVGVTLIQTLDDCSTDDTDGKTVSYGSEVEILWTLVAIRWRFFICCFGVDLVSQMSDQFIGPSMNEKIKSRLSANRPI